MKKLLKNGHVIDPSHDRDHEMDILIEGNTIVDFGHIQATQDMEVIDLAGKLVIPGVIDLHVHFRDMEQSGKETIKTASAAAIKGGVTVALAMPNTKPTLDNAETIKKYQELINEDADGIRIGIAGAISKNLEGKKLAAIDDYWGLGVRFITDDGHDVDDETVLKAAFLKAAKDELTVMVHPEIMHMPGLINEGEVSKKLNVPGQPNEKESKAVERGIKLALETGAKAHFTHITTKESVDLIREAKKKSDKITADTTAHHISLTDEAVLEHGSLAKVNPPLRTEEDRLALIEGIKDGTIDCLVTDHAPHMEKEKGDDLAKAAFGFSEIEIFLPLVLTELHHKQNMPLADVIPLLTSAPARIANLKGEQIELRTLANLAIIDLDTEKTVDRNAFVSKGKNTPFHGATLKGWPVMTVVNGKIYKH